MASTPLASSCQNSAGELAPPGKRQPKPTMAMGSACGYLKPSLSARSCRANSANFMGDIDGEAEVIRFTFDGAKLIVLLHRIATALARQLVLPPQQIQSLAEVVQMLSPM